MIRSMNRRVARTTLLVILVSGLLASCAHVPKAPQPDPPIEAASFWKNQEKLETHFSSITGKTWMKYKGRGSRLVGRGTLTMGFPSSGRWELRDPIGRVAYVATLNGSKLTVFHPGKQTAFEDETAGRVFVKQWLGVEGSFADVQRLVVGILPEPWTKAKFREWAWDPERSLYRGKASWDGADVSVWVHASDLDVQEISLSANGETTQWTYGDYSPCCDGPNGTANQKELFPYLSKLSLKTAGTGIEFQWDKLAYYLPTAADHPFELDLPAGTLKKQFQSSVKLP